MTNLGLQVISVRDKVLDVAVEADKSGINGAVIAARTLSCFSTLRAA